MNAGQQVLLDVSLLEPPEPFERACAALDTLTGGQYIRMLHRREPRLLYPVLDQRCFAHRTRRLAEDLYEILIWSAGDIALGEQLAAEL